MKPVSYFLSLMTVFGLAASVLSGCVDDIKEPGGSLVVSPTEFNNVKGTGETLTINVESDLYWSVYAQDSDRIEKLVNAVNEKNFGALVDIGNFNCADENSVNAVGRMAPYARHAHAKDFHIKSGMLDNPGTGWFQSRGCNYLRGAIIGHGDVPVHQCVNALKRAGYDGYLAIEFEGMEDPITGITVGYSNLKQYV